MGTSFLQISSPCTTTRSQDFWAQITMAGGPLTKLQRISLRILNKKVYNLDALRKRCPLDYGRHTRVPAIRNLSNLGKLPAELLHQILLDIDLQTLLAFREVSMSAMCTVDGVVEYEKVSTALPKPFVQY
jgi:hypothetical protein